jgi:3-keto-5-aminohexanoate cleavage enzyme
MKKLIIEVRVNEYAIRDRNPNVPWSAEEIGRDAGEIREAGASIVHFHARKPDGSPCHDFEEYAAIIRAVRAATDLIVHPTLGQITLEGDDARVSHIVRLAEDRALKPEFASVDIGSTNIDIYDPVAKRFRTGDKTYVNMTRTLIHFVETFRRVGVRPAVVCWAVPFVRYAEAFLDAELIEEPLYMLLVHTGAQVLGGHPPTDAGLRAFRDFLPRGRKIEWTVNSKPGNLFPVAEIAIREGGHVAIGIGDDPYAELGAPKNADLVRRIVEMARSHGREIATPEEAREMLALA